ncbi:hypothetical protein TGRH88_014120 [Toxoplasma gondii]|uniref:Uncharacterized protein n=1 Tax=Toxoplasma gondii TaxID=5811 RepID=A0A7J6KBB3_TOXGO|nr:hypothetical protein TGRH88_014120 [Toxoplasma gondii]
MAAPGGKGGGKANSKATPKGSSSGGRTDTKGVANPQGKAAGSGKKNNRDIDRNPLLGITLEPEVACSLAVKPPTIHSATVVLVLDEEKTSSDPSRGNAETGDIATQLRVSLENLKNAHGRPQTAQNDEEALPEIVLITLEDVFEYGRAKSLLIQDAKAKLGSEMKEEDFARSLAQARAEYLSAVERRRLNILQKDALEQSLSKECESPQPSVSLGEAPSLSGGNRRTTEENRTPLKESLASDTGAVPRNLQLGETHVSGQPRGDEERTDEERDAVVDQIDVLFVLLEVPWSPELCAALSEKRLAVDLILFLTPKSVTELREHSSFDRLPTDLHLFYQTINQAPPGSEFSRTAMETIPNIRQQESLAQPWSLIARKSLQVMQEKAAFSAFLSQTRRVEAAKFLEPTLGLPGDAFLRAKAGPSVAGLGSGRRGGKKEEEQELSTHDDDKKKKKKKTSGKKEQDALDRDRSSAHSGDVGIRGGDPGKPLPSLSENRLVYDALFSSIAAEHQDSALFLHCVMEQVQENVTSQISAAVPDGEGGRPEGPSETAGKNTAANVAVLCRVYPFFPELPPKQTDHLLLLLEFEFLLKSLFPNASTPSLSVSRTFHEQLTPPQLIDTLSETLRTPGMYIAQRYVPRSDTLLLALYHRPRPGCVLSHEWESLEMVPVPSLYEFLSFHRLSRDTEEYQTPTCLADLDRERHGNLRLLEQTLMPHDDSVISVATGTSGAGRLFPFPNLEKLEFEERLEQQQETEKLKRPRLRKHAEETDACTEVRREPRFCPEPLHASRCVSVTRPSTSSTFFLREDQAFAEACEELRVFLEAGVQASLALLAAPQGASQPGKEAAGKDREKEKTGLVSSSRQEPEESQKGPVVEDVDLARKNIFWLETASLASFVSHFEDQTRLHIAAHTVELMDAGRSGRTLLAEEVQNARAAVALTFPTGSVVQVTPDGSIWEGVAACMHVDVHAYRSMSTIKLDTYKNALVHVAFPLDGTVAFRNPSPEEFSLRLSSSHQPPARHLASLRHFVDATLDTLPLDEELPLSPEAAHEAFANGESVRSTSFYMLHSYIVSS